MSTVSVRIVILFIVFSCCLFFFFKQKTAYEMRISDWSSDVCSSDLAGGARHQAEADDVHLLARGDQRSAHGEHRHPQQVEPSQPSGHAEIGRASCRERVCQYV